MAKNIDPQFRAKVRGALGRAFPGVYAKVIPTFGRAALAAGLRQKVSILVVDERFNRMTELDKIGVVVDGLTRGAPKRRLTDKDFARVASINVYGDEELFR